MAELHVISTSIVQPSIENHSVKKIELTPWDHSLLSVDYTQRGILFRKPSSSSVDQEQLINDLKTSLSKTLNIFYPLAGRLAFTQNDDKTKSFYLDCNGSGVKLIQAVVHGVRVVDITESVYVPEEIQSFFPMSGVKSFEGITNPLVVVQVTEIDDGIFIGWGYNHMISDGTSFWHFLNTWSEISRTSNHTLQPPVIKSWFLDGFDRPFRVPFSSDEGSDKVVSSSKLIDRVFHFKREKLAELKAKANAEMGTDRTISTLQALLGHFWRSVTRNRKLDPVEGIKLTVLANMRHRLNPSLPQYYFGNVTQFGTATTTAKELLQHGFGWAALQINKMVALQTDEEARKNLDSWAKTPSMKRLDGFSSNALLVVSSPRLNVYGNDFGWGRPIAALGGLGNNTDGKLSVFPGVEDGSIDIQACFFPSTLEAMSKDAEFMEAVSI